MAEAVQGATGTPFPVRHNRGAGRQTGNSECGVYCLLFLYGACLSGCTFAHICQGMPGDRAVQRFRRVLFSPSCPPPRPQPRPRRRRA